MCFRYSNGPIEYTRRWTRPSHRDANMGVREDDACEFRYCELRCGLTICEASCYGHDSNDSDGRGVTTYEQALEIIGFGKFHYMLLTVCGLIYLNTAVGVTMISFVLPAATCDFQMTSVDKGWLTAAPMLGMLIGSYFWGCLADTKGRKTVLIGALFLDGICGLVSSVSQIFTLFMFLRFFNGFGISGAMGICFPYLGEFQTTKYRETILCWMELFWVLGVIVLPALAWLIIPMPFQLRYGHFMFSSWNLFVLVTALPSLAIAVWLFAFPESPKFLLECGESDAALSILKDMYRTNTGQSSDSFPVKQLHEKERLSICTVSEYSVRSVRTLSVRKPLELKLLLQEIWFQTKSLYRAPHLKYTFTTCAIQFGLTASYYTLMVWFPELFYRFEEFGILHPNSTASLCEVSSVVVRNTTDAEELFCSDPIDDSVYMHVLIIGVSCIPASVCLPLCVNRLGAKFFIVTSLMTAAGVTLGLYFVKNSTQNLILSCVFEALTSVGISTVYCVMVDLFPTNLRVMAAALALTWGRCGALIGNLLFGFLIDLNCAIPIVLFSSLLFVSGILCCTLPSTGQSALE